MQNNGPLCFKALDCIHEVAIEKIDKYRYVVTHIISEENSPTFYDHVGTYDNRIIAQQEAYKLYIRLKKNHEKSLQYH